MFPNLSKTVGLRERERENMLRYIEYGETAKCIPSNSRSRLSFMNDMSTSASALKTSSGEIVFLFALIVCSLALSHIN